MKKLAIYHAPQECGDPYVMFINLEDGQPIGSIDIPSGYWDSGFIAEPYFEGTGEIIKKRHSANYLPKIGDFKHFRGDECLRLKQIENVEPWEFDLGEGCVMKGYHALLVYERCRRKVGYRFDSSKDTFRQDMEKQGINMSGWCVYKRRKTPFMDFLKQILSDEVINIIQIG